MSIWKKISKHPMLSFRKFYYVHIFFFTWKPQVKIYSSFGNLRLYVFAKLPNLPFCPVDYFWNWETPSILHKIVKNWDIYNSSFPKCMYLKLTRMFKLLKQSQLLAFFLKILFLSNLNKTKIKKLDILGSYFDFFLNYTRVSNNIRMGTYWTNKKNCTFFGNNSLIVGKVGFQKKMHKTYI